MFRLPGTLLVCASSTLLLSLLFFASCDEEENKKDTTPPQISVDGVSEGSVLSGVVTIVVDAHDNRGVEKIEIFVDGVLFTTLTAAPFEVEWNTSLLTEGNHVVKVVATDLAGNQASVDIGVIIQHAGSDTVAPEVAITTPVASATVWNTVTVSANVTDNRTIAKVEFAVDGFIFQTVTQSPYTAQWNSSTAPDGEKTFKVIATDQAGNKTEKQVIVKLQNVLVRVSVPSDQLTREDTFVETGALFLSDDNGKLIASIAFDNGQQVEIKAPGFSGETFYLTQVQTADYTGGAYIRLWTYSAVGRGNWVLMREKRDDDAYAGDVTINYNNPLPDAFYQGSTNGDEAYADVDNTSQTIRLRNNPSQLYMTREFYSGDPAPTFRLFPTLEVGTQTINLADLTQPMTKVTASIPAEVVSPTVYLWGFSQPNNFNEPYRVDRATMGNGTGEVYYPGTAFSAYHSEIYYSTAEFELGRGTYDQPGVYNFNPIAYSGTFTRAGGKINYSATGDFDFVSTGYFSNNNDTRWLFVGPKGSNLSFPTFEVPAALEGFALPDMTGSPELYTIYDMGGINDYQGFINYIRQSDYGVDDLYEFGKNYTTMTIFQTPVGGRMKPRARSKGLSLRLNEREEQNYLEIEKP
jgi:hypothetical protein